MISYREADLLPNMQRTRNMDSYKRLADILWFHMDNYFNNTERNITDIPEWAWVRWITDGKFYDYLKERVGENTIHKMSDILRDKENVAQFKQIFKDHVREQLGGE